MATATLTETDAFIEAQFPVSKVSKADIEAADDAGTVQNDRLQCPACGRATPMKMIRGDQRGENGTANALRNWTNEDVTPRPRRHLSGAALLRAVGGGVHGRRRGKANTSPLPERH
jgi:hypothetical protein